MVLPKRREFTMRNAIGYIRVSTEDQADSGLGLEAQRQRIKAYCEMKGLHLAEILEDTGVSGGKALSTRPAGG
jgi:site-specific DNA recombinase